MLTHPYTGRGADGGEASERLKARGGGIDLGGDVAVIGGVRMGVQCDLAGEVFSVAESRSQGLLGDIR